MPTGFVPQKVVVNDCRVVAQFEVKLSHYRLPRADEQKAERVYNHCRS